VPGAKIAGLSKFNRVVDWFAARPQIQEELVVQIADFIENQLRPKGVAVVIRAAHTCMTWRGVREHADAKMTTNVMRGVFRDKPEARAEFLAAIAGT
jgi:GTP cyclohydrolase I